MHMHDMPTQYDVEGTNYCDEQTGGGESFLTG